MKMGLILVKYIKFMESIADSDSGKVNHSGTLFSLWKRVSCQFEKD